LVERSRRDRKRRDRRPPRRAPSRTLRGLAVFLLLLLVVGVGTVVSSLLTPFPTPRVREASVIVDAEGRLIGRIFTENRTLLDISEISPYLVDAVVAIEDERFYRHKGIDPQSLARALVANIRAGRVVEGGSTITQQLVKNLFLTPERTLSRKVREALLTIKLETLFTKREILEMYLNQIYLGHGAYGAEVAARIYFGKHAKDLTLAESALLAGIIRSPERLSPYKAPDKALARRKLVLDKMVELGMISPEQAAEAAREELRLAGLDMGDRRTAYFQQFVLDELERIAPELVRRLPAGGYRIETSLDLEMQEAAVRAFTEGLPPGRPDAAGVLQPQGALVAIDPRTGYIKAMVGGRDFEKSPLNRTLARRQPGSAFKPFVYAAVLEEGYPVTSRKRCEPVSFGPEKYTPTDFGRRDYHFRSLTIREALRISDNVVAVRWLAEVGPERAVRQAREMGIESDLAPNLPLVLGASAVTPLEMAAAYAPLANLGFRVQPIALIRVTDDAGNVLIENRPRVERVLDERVSFLLTDVLKDVLRPGGTAAGLGPVVGRPAAGKTGTAEDGRGRTVNLWFVGYTPELVAAVYVGADRPAEGPPLAGTGGSVAGPIWARFMAAALAGRPAVDFPRPAGIVELEVCRETGLLPNETCPTYTELFIEGTEPRRRCPVDHNGADTPPEEEPPPDAADEPRGPQETERPDAQEEPPAPSPEEEPAEDDAVR